MPTRISAFPLCLAILTGCAATDNYDSTVNPFEEPAQPTVDAMSHPPRPQASSNVATATLAPQAPLSLNPGVFDKPVAIALPAGPDRTLEMAPSLPSLNARQQEMLDEANRLGGIDDLHGKADLLKQLGFSGSPKAFYDLARMYLDGSFPKDMSQAVLYITLAHEAGYDEASRVLGILYVRGEGVPADEAYGRLLLEQAAKTSTRAAREYGQLLVTSLNDPELGWQFLTAAADRGDSQAALLLAEEMAKIGNASEAERLAVQAQSMAGATPPSPPSNLQDRARRGDTAAMFRYASELMLRKIPSSEPEFTAYCWLSVAKLMGSQEAAKELVLIEGVRGISDRKNPGRLDQCISDLHYQINGANDTASQAR